MRRLCSLALVAALSGLPGPALACGLQLILAVDVSGSIDQDEWQMQAEGMAAAFEDDEVIAAIEGLPGGLLVTYMQWSGLTQQEQMTPWTLIGDADGARSYARSIRAAPRRWSLESTALGEALRFARGISLDAPIECQRKVIDVAGDGYSNLGPFPGPMADQLAKEGHVINGMVIEGAQPDPVPFYILEVMAGEGAFVETAKDFSDYPAAFRRKLLREIGKDVVIGAAP